MKRISTDLDASQREGVALAVYTADSVAERSLCGESGTCLGVPCEAYALLCNAVRGEAWRMSALAARKMDADSINKGGTAGFSVPLGFENSAFLC